MAGEEWSTSDAEAGSAEEVEQFRRRQISRMPILGATVENKAPLEESYHRILAAFEPHVGMTKYLFGSRPSLADFAWNFGPNPPSILVLGDGANSNFILSLKGVGPLFDNNTGAFGEMPANANPPAMPFFFTDDQIQPIIDWITINAPIRVAPRAL